MKSNSAKLDYFLISITLIATILKIMIFNNNINMTKKWQYIYKINFLHIFKQKCLDKCFLQI